MKTSLFIIGCLLAIFPACLKAQNYPEPLMVTPGEVILSKTFDTEKDLDKSVFKFRKQTQGKVKDGALHVLPARVINAGKETDSKWGQHSVARGGVSDLPKEFVCQFRWKYLKPEDERAYSKRNVYIDLGHRCIRTSFSAKGTTLKLENHLVGKGGSETSKLLRSRPGLILDADRWYDITIEVKGNEVVYQIDGVVLYGKEDLITKERANTFNLDSGGVGYLLDEVIIRAAGDFKSDWSGKRASYEDRQANE